MPPESVGSWLTIFRDLTIVLVGAFMLIFETVFSKNPNITLIGAGAALLGVPPVLRLDFWARQQERSEEEQKGQRRR